MRLVAHPRHRELLADAHGRHGAHTLSSLSEDQPRSPDPQRPRRRVRGRRALPKACLVIEADSRTYHDTPTMRANDAEKDRHLQAAGHDVLRLRGEDLHDATATHIHMLLPGAC